MAFGTPKYPPSPRSTSRVKCQPSDLAARPSARIWWPWQLHASLGGSPTLAPARWAFFHPYCALVLAAVHRSRERSAGSVECRIRTIRDLLDAVMEIKSSDDDSSSSSSSSRLRFRFEVPLGYVVEDVRPNGGFEKLRRAGFTVCVRKPS